MAPGEFRRAASEVASIVAGYLERLEDLPVFPRLEPGQLRSRLPAAPPVRPEPIEAILDDYRTLIEPSVTHWQHPMFLGYFPSVASGPGILGEWLAAGLNANVMFWRNAPGPTELEETIVSWLRQAMGLPDAFDGMFTDTASVSTLLALVAARHAVPGLAAREEGLAGRPDLKRLRLYASEEAHFSVERAAIVIGAGRAGLRKIPTDEDYRMRADLLESAIEEDRQKGWLPFAVVATAGTTSSTSVDPLARLASLCEREGLWLHVDAAYAGAAAVLPEVRPLLAGWERADSIVVNPHKWLFTPLDASLLLFRRPEMFRGAFSLGSDYLPPSGTAGAHDFYEYGIQLGRRFRALKMWILLRWFGLEGIAARLREQIRLAREFAAWVDADPDWERLAPVPFSTVCFRFRPRRAEAFASGSASRLDALNEALLERVNRTGAAYLSSTRLRGRYALRVAFGNPRTTEQHARRCFELLRSEARAILESPP
jgi:aromatic-L-amino-acid decarboxylase